MLLICVPIRTGFVKLLTSGKKRNLIILKESLILPNFGNLKVILLGGIQKVAQKFIIIEEHKAILDGQNSFKGLLCSSAHAGEAIAHVA